MGVARIVVHCFHFDVGAQLESVAQAMDCHSDEFRSSSDQFGSPLCSDVVVVAPASADKGKSQAEQTVRPLLTVEAVIVSTQNFASSSRQSFARLNLPPENLLALQSVILIV